MTRTTLLQEDDCASDAWESFSHEFPKHANGMTLQEFKQKADRFEIDDGLTIEYRLGQLRLICSADDPYWLLACEQS